MTTKLVIGTRGSKLALAQSEMMAAALRAAHPGLAVELQVISTKGDRILDVALSAVGDKGLFVKELETALLEGAVDLAVHSGKDLPSLVPDGLTLAAFPRRADPRDALVTFAPRANGATPAVELAALPSGTRVGTSSLRRACQLRALRPDLTLLDVRGNVDTRLRKLADGHYDALILAAAGLQRLGMASADGGELNVLQFPQLAALEGRFVATSIAPEVMLPAVAQGTLAIEARADDAATLARLTVLDDAAARAAALAERAFLRRLEGGCQVPIAAYAELRSADALLTLYGLVGALDGSVMVRGERSGSSADAETLGVALANELLARGADQILAEIEAAGQR